jgi:RNA polymerase sigma-70 factor (ECF subfamily)
MDFEATLIERAQRQDREALIEIYNRYYDSVYTYVYYRVPDQPTTEDITAEVFIRMVSRIQAFTYHRQTILAWLYTIARNLVADYFRANKHVSSLKINDEYLIDTQNPHHLVEFNTTQAQLISSIGQLTEDQQQVILMKFIGGQSNAAIAEYLGKTEGSVKSMQYRALASLKRILIEEHGYEPT